MYVYLLYHSNTAKNCLRLVDFAGLREAMKVASINHASATFEPLILCRINVSKN